jgi:hypothetical protein
MPAEKALPSEEKRKARSKAEGRKKAITFFFFYAFSRRIILSYTVYRAVFIPMI